MRINPYTILFFLLLWFLAALFLYDNWQDKQAQHLSKDNAVLETNYLASVEMYRLASSILFAEITGHSEVLDAFAEGINSEGEIQARARYRLHQLLYNTYQQLKLKGILLFHFHTADARSFLRFHVPEKYGDSLLEVRPSLRIANTEKKVVAGFELGRVKSGFRNVFPIFQGNSHLGSVEFSISFDKVHEAMSRLDTSRQYALVLNKQEIFSVLDKKWQSSYPPSEIHSGFVVDRVFNSSSSLQTIPDIIEQINTLLRQNESVHKNMNNSARFTQPVVVDGISWAVSFIPIKDILNQEVGYFISYGKDPFLNTLKQDFIQNLIIASLLLLSFFLYIGTLIKSRASLQREKKHLATITDTIGDGLYVLDVQGVITQINPAFTELLGYTADEVVGKIGHNIFHAHGGVQARMPLQQCPIYKVTQSGQSYYGEEFFRHKSGQLLTVEVTSKPFGRKENWSGSVSAFRDVTQRKQLENELRQSETRFRDMSEVSSDWMWEVDAHGCYTYVSSGVTKILGYQPAELIGKRPFELMPAEEAKRLENLYGSIMAEKRVFRSLENTNRHQDGHLITLSTSGMPILNERGELLGYRGADKDISKRKESELQLHQARVAAESANQAKSEFLANMSHEIRTPMNGVIGMVSLLLDDDLNEQQYEQAKTIKRSAESLLSIINDILDLSKIEAGKFDLEIITFDLASLIEEFAESVSFQSDEKGLEFNCCVNLALHRYYRGDAGRIRQILNNLVGNAIKFTEKGMVSVVYETVKEDEQYNVLRFSVTDTGIGLSEEQRQRLFQRFTQADGSTTRKYGGTGLGLTISKQLAEMMGGDIGFTSEPDKGSTFWFTIKLEKTDMLTSVNDAQDSISEISEETKDVINKDAEQSNEQYLATILVVEDNRTNQLVARGMLRKFGLEVELAGNGEEALKALSESSYDLVFMDCQMPVMDGYEATRQIRSSDSSVKDHKVPVVAMTANAMQGDREKCLLAGMDDYISKPINRQKVNTALKKWLSKATYVSK